MWFRPCDQQRQRESLLSLGAGAQLVLGPAQLMVDTAEDWGGKEPGP